MSDIQEQIECIKREITRRRLILGDALPECDIVAFEKTAKVRLPEEYRQFLLQVGNGGDGPGWRSVGLDRPPEEWGMYPLGRNRTESVSPDEVIRRLSRPFPYTEPCDANDRGILPKRASNGNLPLAEEGGGMWWHLIVTGDERGQVWLSSEHGIDPLAPRRSFLDWYRYWVEGGNDWYAGLG